MLSPLAKASQESRLHLNFLGVVGRIGTDDCEAKGHFRGLICTKCTARNAQDAVGTCEGCTLGAVGSLDRKTL